MNSTIRIFLASSSELENDRKELELFLGRKNKLLQRKEIYLELMIWEDFIDCMSKTRLQDEYNKAVQQADIFIMLFFTKVGKFTLQEFQTAFESFSKTGKPFIYTYFKNDNIKTGEMDFSSIESLFKFKNLLKELGHFETLYSNTDYLKNHLYSQLEKLEYLNQKSVATTINTNREELALLLSMKNLISDKYEYVLEIQDMKSNALMNYSLELDKLRELLDRWLLLGNLSNLQEFREALNYIKLQYGKTYSQDLTNTETSELTTTFKLWLENLNYLISSLNSRSENKLLKWRK